MKQAFLKIGSLMPVIGALVLSGNCAWGAIVACPTAGPGTSFSTLGVSSTTGGCYQNDLSYTSLNVTGGASTGSGTSLSTTNISLYSTGTAASGNTIGPVNMFVDGFASITTGNSSESGTVDVQATANTGTVGGINYTSPTTAGQHWAYTSLTLDPVVGSIGTGDSVTVTENFCISATQATVGGTCATADHGVITATFTASTTPAYTCVFGTAGICLSASSNEVNLSSLTPTAIAIAEGISIIRATGGGTVTLTNVENSFGESSISPEPSSVSLLGLALVGLGALRVRRKKSA